MGQTPIFTIGYGSRPIAAFIAVLRAHQIAYLLDVRSQPYSRYQPDYSQKALAQHLETAGIRYVFMGDALGGRPDDPACYTDGKVDYDKVAAQPFYRQGVDRLQAAYRQQARAALMCSEGKPEQCHRSKLIGRTLVAAGVPVVHIDEHDQLVTQVEVLLRVVNHQPSLFGDDFHQLTSRKRYAPETLHAAAGDDDV